MAKVEGKGRRESPPQIRALGVRRRRRLLGLLAPSGKAARLMERHTGLTSWLSGGRTCQPGPASGRTRHVARAKRIAHGADDGQSIPQVEAPRSGPRQAAGCPASFVCIAARSLACCQVTGTTWQAQSHKGHDSGMPHTNQAQGTNAVRGHDQVGLQGPAKALRCAGGP